MPAQPISAQNSSPYFPIQAVIDESVTAFVPDKRQREYVGAWRRFLGQSLSDPAYRQFAKGVLGDPGSILKFMQVIGHGLYVGV